MTVFWIFVCSAAIVAAAYFAGKPRRDKMIADKKIVARPYEWYKNAEVFTLSGADFDRVEEGIVHADFSGTGASATKNDGRKAIGFKAGTWRAEIYKKENDGDKDVYYFHFVQWDTHRGTPYGLMEMNILLTAVEKVFLQIDPGTQVKTIPIKVSSKPSFF